MRLELNLPPDHRQQTRRLDAAHRSGKTRRRTARDRLSHVVSRAKEIAETQGIKERRTPIRRSPWVANETRFPTNHWLLMGIAIRNAE